MAETKLDFVDVENIEEQQSNKGKRKRIIAAFVLVAAVAAALVLYLILIVPGASNLVNIYITEVVTSNNLSYVDEELGSPDWIEIYNASSFDVSLEGYGISDIAVLPYRYMFGDVTIGAGEYLVVFATQDRGTEHICLGFSLSKEGETITLTNDEGVILQMLDVPELSRDKSWGLTSDGQYKYMAAPTAGADNSGAASDTPDSFEMAVGESVVVVSEIMPSVSQLNEGAAGQYPWAELYNTADEAVNLRNFYLSDNIDNIKKWRLPDMELAAHAYVLVYISGNDLYENELHTNFSLSGKETTLYFSDGNIGTTSEVSWDGGIAKHVSVGLDSDGAVMYFGVPTPGEVNSAIAFDSFEKTQIVSGLKVNEILLDNTYSIRDEDGDSSAWVEFFNSSGSTIALGNYYLSDREANPYKWRFPNMLIEPGKYLVVYLSGKDRAGSELHTGFRIGDDETMLVMTDRENMAQASFALDMQIGKNVSYGNADGEAWQYFGQPTPGAQNTTNGFDEIASAGLFDIGGVYINEVSSVAKPKSGELDWIEIRNGTDSDISLEGYYLSDSLNDPYMWQMPSITVKSGGYAVIYASDTAQEQTENTAPFNIAVSGEKLVLSAPSGVVIDMFDTGVIGVGNSAGRLNGDEQGGRVFFTTTTKGKANADEGYSAYTSEPIFSVLGGYADKGTVVQISCADENAQIYYTINGDRPTTNSELYTDGVEIRESLPLRAIAVSADKMNSPIVTKNYLVEKQHDIAVICISGDWDDINYAYSSSKSNREKEVHIEYYEPDGKIGVSFPAGIRVVGLISRSYPQKSLNIYLRGGYGQSDVVYPFFDDYPIVEFASLTIRNSGQDLYYSHMKTAFFEMAVQDMDVDNMQQKPVAVYINGRYWGMYWLSENQNEDHFAQVYDFDRDDIEVVRRNSTAVFGTNTEFLDVRRFARGHDMGIEENYNEFIGMVDEQAFIDYIIVQTFINNWDMYNQKYWRTVDYEHEWRPMLFDLDYAFRYGGGPSYLGSYFSRYGVTWMGGNFSKTNMDIPYALMQNEGWKQAFIERYAYVLQTTFAPETIAAMFDSMVKEVESEMARHVKRWHAPRSISSWQKEVDRIRGYLLVRADQCKDDLQRYFNLSDERMAQLFPDDGY